MEKSVSVVRQVVADILLMPAERIDCHCALSQLPEWDSIVQLTLLMVIEERTGYRLDIEQVSSTNTVADVARMLGDGMNTVH
ncbi:acyl carrier protein [Nitratireductor sp. XY-223]|uniref:acyl carrier protein n=1 Tax=Nitratireductor sp. XY-223 TaxID=2561926 RepID=UPI0010AAFA5B|nr:acyl carrier protein [Nitratireductor sp. XY-223]